MANRTITLKAQKIRSFGPSPSQKWNSFLWGVNTWGMKAPIVGSTPALQIVAGQNVIVSLKSQKILSSSQKISQFKADSTGFYGYQFVDRVSNALLRASDPSYASFSAVTPSYTSSSAGPTTWRQTT